jgi:hypothetical protein
MKEPDQFADSLRELDFALAMTVGQGHLESQSTYQHVASVWTESEVTHASFDEERRSLLLASNGLRARLALRDAEEGAQVAAMTRVELTRVRAFRVGGELAVVVSSSSWTYWLRPEAVVLDPA